MKRWLGILGSGFILLLVLGSLTTGFKTYDYGLECTRCLRAYHVVEKSYRGYVYSKTQTLEFAGYDLESITGKPCEHIYRTTGFGRQWYGPFMMPGLISDGMTAEGHYLGDRFNTLEAAFKLYQRLPNKDLMTQTLAIIDECIPDDTSVASVNDPNRRPLIPIPLWELRDSLRNAKTELDWTTAVRKASAAAAAAKAALR